MLTENEERDLSDRRLLKFTRRQVNQELRAWRKRTDFDTAAVIADCKARLRLLSWADSWMRPRERDYSEPRVTAAMRAESELVLHGIRILAQAYKGRAGWRDEWEILR